MSTEETKPILLSIDRSLTQLEADVAESAAAQTEMANTLSTLASLPQQVEELKELVRLLAGKVAEAYDAVNNLNSRFGLYVQETARERSGVANVDRRLRLLEQAREASDAERR